MRGNVWEWLNDNLNPLTGYKPHFIYGDNSAIFFDDKHHIKSVEYRLVMRRGTHARGKRQRGINNQFSITGFSIR